MIFNNKDVIHYIANEKDKIIHTFGESDSGKTRSAFFMINELNKLGKICSYVYPGVEYFQYEAFNKFIEYPNQTPVLQAVNREEFSTQSRSLAPYVDVFIVDGFLRYIIHKPVKEIRKMFQEVSLIAFKYKVNFILINEMRYSQEKDLLIPAYDKYFKYFCQKHILIKKDDNYDISFGFVENYNF